MSKTTKLRRRRSQPKQKNVLIGNVTTPRNMSTGARRSAFECRIKPSTTSISLRLPVSLLEQIKIAANKRDVPYQSLIKIWLAEKVR